MIRTRDLVIFLGLLMIMFVGIVLTLVRDAQREYMSLPSFFGTDTKEEVYVAEKGGDTYLDRESIIERLRSAISQGKPEIEPLPSVEESEASVSDTDVIEEVQDIAYCPTYDDSIAVARSWPLSVSIKEEGGFRKVVEDVKTSASASSSATSTANERLLLAIPASPVAFTSSCVPGEVIGVSVAGRVMLNSQVALYRGYGADYLIGYARDGFPIYGYYEGETDTCGGYEHPSGYRYTITPDREHVVSCFKGTPASFIGF